MTSSLILILATKTHAIDTPDVLPQGIRNASLKIGNFSGLNQYYTNAGELKYLKDVNTFEISTDAAIEADKRVLDLINTLNQVGSQKVGDQVDLGNITIDAQPEVTYLAPVFLYGVTDRLTIGLAIPVITFKNTMAVTSSGSNISQLKKEFSSVDPQYASGFQELENELDNAFYKKVNEQGYKPVTSRDEQFIGDIQLISAYQILKDTDTAHTVQFYLGLPTGPEPDADDLTDIETFHRWSLKPNWVSRYELSSRYAIIGSTSYQIVLPSTVEKRVPLDADDSLPDTQQKMNVKEDIGDSFAVNGAIAFKATSNITATTGYSYEVKQRDVYGGVPSGRSQFLEHETEKDAHIAKIELAYSSVQDYLNKKAIIPGSIGYEFSQVFDGRNVENQQKHELTLNIFF